MTCLCNRVVSYAYASDTSTRMRIIRLQHPRDVDAMNTERHYNDQQMIQRNSTTNK